MPNIVNPAVAVAAQGGGKRKMHCITLYSSSSISLGKIAYAFPYFSEKDTPFASGVELVNAIDEDGFNKPYSSSAEVHVYPVNGATLMGIYASTTALFLVDTEGNVSELEAQSNDKVGGFFFSDTVIEL